jgi:hypothetical protein
MFGPEVLLAALGLGSSGVVALWRIASALGRYEARTALVLETMGKMLGDHEDRLRDLEQHPRTR